MQHSKDTSSFLQKKSHHNRSRPAFNSSPHNLISDHFYFEEHVWLRTHTHVKGRVFNVGVSLQCQWNGESGDLGCDWNGGVPDWLIALSAENVEVVSSVSSRSKLSLLDADTRPNPGTGCLFSLVACGPQSLDGIG